MSSPTVAPTGLLSRRSFLQLGAVGLAALPGSPGQAAGQEKPVAKGQPTQFQIACMTLPYGQFPLARALTGLQSVGYRYVAWGNNHREADGKRVPILPAEAPPDKARELGKRCRDLGLEPLMLFSGIYPEAKNHREVLQNRIRQAAAAGIPQVLTFGNTKDGDRKLWIEHFKTLGPMAREHGVLVVIKPHGGLTARGALCAAIVRDVADEGVKVNYDAGNVMDYLKIDAAATLADFQQCAAEVRSFCIKDHRMFPRDEDCGPGLGEIDHYRLLAPVAFTGRVMPLCCENISAPGLSPAPNPEAVDALARRAREFLELVTRGLQATPGR